jgi:hypothetical protein
MLDRSIYQAKTDTSAADEILDFLFMAHIGATGSKVRFYPSLAQNQKIERYSGYTISAC